MTAPPLTCAIIDDDEIARLTLEHYISQCADLHLTAMLTDGVRALEWLQAGNRADLLFLDVQMPLLSGLELLRLLPEPPSVILTTARPDFAVEAFELRVADYLVKPFEFWRFRQAVERVRQRQAVPAAAPVAVVVAAEPAVFVKTNNRIVRVPLVEILYVEAVASYAVVVTTTQQLLSNQSIKEFSDRLPTPQFARVHRSYIVNRQRIEAIEDNVILLQGGRTVPVGKTYLTEFLASLK